MELDRIKSGEGCLQDFNHWTTQPFFLSCTYKVCAWISAPRKTKQKPRGPVLSSVPLLSCKQTDLGDEQSAISAAESGAVTAWPSLNSWPLYWRQEMNKS